MNDFQRRVRAAVYSWFINRADAPSSAGLASELGTSREQVVGALHALADEHCLVLRAGRDEVWMAHPFSAVETDCVVSVGERRWFANCAWDGLAILGMLGDGTFATRSPATDEPLVFTTYDGVVTGEGVVHFLVPARQFWDDIGHT